MPDDTPHPPLVPTYPSPSREPERAACAVPFAAWGPVADVVGAVAVLVAVVVVGAVDDAGLAVDT